MDRYVVLKAGCGVSAPCFFNVQPPSFAMAAFAAICSASFLLRPAAERLGFRLIASRVDRRSGWTLGENNHSEEKVTRFYKEYPNVEIAEFYSDSLSDTPLARLAERAFLVSGQCLEPWPERSLRL